MITKNNFYGSLTSGAGTRLTKKLFFEYSPESINLYKISILNDLKRTKIPIKKNFNILDVGTGRQALAFSKITKGSIDHIDLSNIHVKKTKSVVKKLKIKNLNSICANLDYYKKLEKNKYDLIYLQGIIQHFKNPQKAMENILPSLKVGGYAFLYIYKSGTFRQFIDHLIRLSIRKIFKRSIKIKDIIELKKKLLKKKNVYLIDNFIDSIFVEFSWLFNNNKVFKSFSNSGFKIIKKISCYKKNQYHDHSDKWGAFIFSIKKTNDKSIHLKSLNPINSCKEPLRQYSKNKAITKTINLFDKLTKNKFSNKKKIDILLELYSIADRVNVNKKSNLKHKDLQSFLIKILKEKKTF